MQTQPPTQKSRAWSESSFISEVVTGTVLALWIVYAAIEAGKMTPYFIAEVGLVLYAIFMFSVFYKHHTDRKFELDTLHSEQKAQLDTLRVELQAKDSELFTREVQGKSSIQGEILNIRRYALETVVQMLVETLQDTSLPQEKRAVYEEIAKRIRDMERSLWQSYEQYFLRGAFTPAPVGTTPPKNP